MNGVYKHYVIDLSCNNNFVQIPVVQGDGNNVRGAELELIANNVQYPVDEETMVISIAGTKPDNTFVLNPCGVTEEGFVLVDITYQMSAVKGVSTYNINIMDRKANSLLQSFPFNVITTKSAWDASEIVSSNEYQLLTHTVVDAKNTIDDMRELEAEVTANEDARKLAETAREQSENARKQAETLREHAEIAREQAEQKRQADTATAIQNAQKATTDTIAAIKDANDATAKANQATSNTLDAIQDAVNATNDAITATKAANDTTARVNALETSFTNAENIRVQNENTRIQNEKDRQDTNTQALAQLNTATADTVAATNRANTVSDDLVNKLNSGYFNGKDGVDGKDGKDGVIMSIGADQYAFSIVGDDLILTYDDGT